MKPEEIAERVDKGLIKTRKGLKDACKDIKYSEVLKHVKKKTSRRLLRKKPTRSLSGVSVVALMCKPHNCPGECTYCPRGEGAPQSYTGNEPAAMRAANNDYGPYKQVRDRLEQYEATGHDSTKIELIVMGGTFLSTPVSYQEEFMKGAYQALNKSNTNNLDKLKKENESAVHRCVALTFETRPDTCSEEHIARMVYYGGTRCELGCQSVYDDVLRKVNRGHGVKCTKDAIKRLKNAGFKVDLHLMPGLPGSSFKRDVKMFKKVFSDQGFMPDGLKIYPCLVMEGTELYEDWQRGDYQPLSDEQAAKMIAKGLEQTPPWVRVKRVMRDIPTTLVSAGPRKSNLRQLAWKQMSVKCNCIRCRETGRKREASEASLSIIEYKASGGREFFISYEDFNTASLIGFARLRLSSEAFLRELHVYGNTTPVGAKSVSWQHKGYGSKLLREAEETAKSKGYDKLRVLSGAGVRGYYKNHDYVLRNDYMVKRL
ncbi:tRNA uridine(34) 5-carboxymethylaminomethyl modification radical SAM/GNAT enzyme Elp3 [archaeon]|nr:tRNA uridine(34) 5-carboxymethylaminomethyl modification radical SAM/GNAT enzyme Elp3 [archaeon]